MLKNFIVFSFNMLINFILISKTVQIDPKGSNNILTFYRRKSSSN